MPILQPRPHPLESAGSGLGMRYEDESSQLVILCLRTEWPVHTVWQLIFMTHQQVTPLTNFSTHNHAVQCIGTVIQIWPALCRYLRPVDSALNLQDALSAVPMGVAPYMSTLEGGGCSIECSTFTYERAPVCWFALGHCWLASATTTAEVCFCVSPNMPQ